MKSKLISITLLTTLALLGSLSGCGSTVPTESEPPTDSTPTQAGSTAETAAPTEPTEDLTGVELDADGNIIIRMPKSPGSFYPEFTLMVNEFNAEDNGYVIETVDYSQYMDESFVNEGGVTPEAYDKVNFQIQMDILSGGKLHLVPSRSFEDIGAFDLLLEKGAFLDLYPMLETDDEINTETLNAHVLELFAKDGKLYSLPTIYTIVTMMGKTAYVGEKENWTFAELLAHWDAMTVPCTFNGNTDRDGVYREILRSNLGAFLDYENGTCSFDSPEFVEMLEFCQTFKPPAAEKIEPDFQKADFAQTMMFTGFEDYHLVLWNGGSGDALTFVGFPSPDGTGTFLDASYERYAICADAPPAVQKGAWEFIRRMASKEYWDTLTASYHSLGFPVNNAAFEQEAAIYLEKTAQGETNIKYFGSGDIQKDVGFLTQAEYDRLCTWIDNIHSCNREPDRKLMAIINEELLNLFHGNGTPEQAAEAIQGRASIYISEQS